MKKIVFGIGNTLRSDDGVGFIAAERLADELADDDIEFIACHQLTPELVEPLHEAQYAIFIDASVTAPPGEIQHLTLKPGNILPSGVSHHFSPQQLLGFCMSIYGTCPNAELISIGAASFDLGEDFSPPVANALEVLLLQIKSQLTEE